MTKEQLLEQLERERDKQRKRQVRYHYAQVVLKSGYDRSMAESFRKERRIIDKINALGGRPTPEGACCPDEKRNMNGGCDSCGDPCL